MAAGTTVSGGPAGRLERTWDEAGNADAHGGTSTGTSTATGPGVTAGRSGRRIVSPSRRSTNRQSVPTFVITHCASGRICRHISRTWSRAAAVGSHGGVPMLVMAMSSLRRKRSMRGWSAG